MSGHKREPARQSEAPLMRNQHSDGGARLHTKAFLLSLGLFLAAATFAGVLRFLETDIGFPFTRVALGLMFLTGVTAFVVEIVRRGKQLQQIPNPRRPWQSPCRKRTWSFGLFGLAVALVVWGTICGLLLSVMGGLGGMPYFVIVYATSVLALIVALFLSVDSEFQQRRVWQHASSTKRGAQRNA